MPEELNPYASPAIIPHDRAPPPSFDPLDPLRGPSLGLLLSSGLVAVPGLFYLPVLGFQTIWALAFPGRGSVPEGAFLIPMFIASYPILIGAWNMRSGTRYRWAYLAAVLACIPMLTPAFYCGIPLGIWSLIVLYRRDVKAVFAARAAPTSRH